MRKLIFLLVLGIGQNLSYSQTCTAGLSGTYKIGPSGAYPSLTAALNGMRTNGISANVILELQTGYTSNTETFPINFEGINCLAASRTLLIRPETGASNLVISSANSSSTLLISNARYVAIDGRPGGQGTASQLKIANTSQTATAISFLNDASYNQLRYLTIQSTNANPQGHVYFGTSTLSITNGNSFNEISYCNFRYETFYPNFHAIYSAGSLNKKNRGNIIRHCNIQNSANAGIHLSANSEAWTIDSNSFYGSPWRKAAIYIDDTTSSGFSITGNYIGGTAPACGGTKLQFIDPFQGIQVFAGTASFTSIQDNTIANVQVTSGNGRNFIGIHMPRGKFRCGDIRGNMVGSETDLRSITYVMNSIFYDDFAVYGILVNGGYNYGRVDTAYIRNNKVCGLFAHLTSNSIGHGNIIGIGIREQDGDYVEITDNIIGHPTKFNSIQNIAGAGPNLVTGIDISYPNSTAGRAKNIVRNNQVAHLNGNCTGINVLMSHAEVRNNYIHGLYANYHQVDNGNAVGIVLSNTSDSCVASGNTIHTLHVKSQSPEVNAIRVTYSSHGLIEKNTIHSLVASPTFNAARFRGIHMDYSTGNRILNNMIRLGIDTSGNPINGDHEYMGISVSATNTTTSHNSVYIGGTGYYSSYGFVSNQYPQVVTNNIFYNAHSGTAGTNYKNYAFFYNGDSIQRIHIDYNIYYAPGTGGYLAGYYRNYTLSEATTINDWRLISKQDSHSMAYNPNFKNPSGSVTSGDLHLANPNPAEGQGGPDAGVTEDLDGEARNSLSPVDIGADAGNFSLQDGDAPLLTHAPFIGQVISTPTTYQLSITDNGGGVDTAGNKKPRMWYRKKYPATTAWTSVNGTLQTGTTSNGTWSFVPDLSLLGTPVSPGDSLEYYFVAQDKGPVINLGYSNKSGTVHTQVNSQTSAPSSPLRLVMMGQFTDTVRVGAGETYTSLTGAGGFFEATNKMIFRPDLDHAIVYITSDLAETGSFAYVNYNTTGTTVHIRTVDAVVKKIRNSVNLTQNMIRLGNTHHLEIDGSVNGTGRYLQFTNGHTSPNFGRPALSLNNADSVVIRNCIFEGNANQIYMPVVDVNANLAKGLKIENNLIRNIQSGPETGLPQYSIILGVSNGDTVFVRNNEISNFKVTGLRIAQSGINPSARLLVENNHIYHTSSENPAGSRTAIEVHSQVPVLLLRNYIGGSAPYCGGDPWTFALQASGNTVIRGIYLDVSKDSMSYVKENVVRNIRINNFGYGFQGIFANGDVALDIDGNRIGDPATDSSIVNSGNSTGISIRSGIYSAYRPQVVIRNNEVSGMTGNYMEGINMEVRIGRLTDNKVQRMRSRSGYKGLKIWMEQGLASGNEASDLSSANAGNTYGMEMVANGPLPNEMLVERNRVFNLSSTGGTLVGIVFQNGQYKIRNNTVSLTNGNAPSGIRLYGLHFSMMAGNVFRNEVSYNTIYIGGNSNSTDKSAAVYIDGGSPVTSFRNNLLYNERSGTGTHLALVVLPLSGASAWTEPYIPNHNFYVTRDTSAVNEWQNFGTLGMPLWRNYVRGDRSSFASTISHVPSAKLFVNAIEGDLHINTTDSLCWYVNGKGIPIDGVSGDMDTASGIRSVTIATGATDIGADEFSTNALPPQLIVTGAHMPGSIDTLSLDGRIVATIQWGNTGTLPTLGEARYFSGVWPNDTTNLGQAYFARYLNAYWNIPASGGSGYSYDLTLYYDSSILGRVSDVAHIVMNKRQSGVPGSWITIQPTLVDTVRQTITIRNQTSFSEFTATDSLATLTTGVPLPDLNINAQNINPATIPTGSNFTINFTESNSGPGTALSHKVSFYLSEDNQFNPGMNGDTLLAIHEVVNSILPGYNTGLINKQLLMPCNLNPGTYFLFIVADGTQQVTESSEANNTAHVAVTVAAGATLPAPTITAMPGTIVCSGTPVLLTATSSNCTGCTYTWSNGATTADITVSGTGTYKVNVSNVCGTSSATQAVTINPLPAVTLEAVSTTVCLGSTVTLNASGAASYSWTGIGLGTTTGSSVTATPTAAGSYQYSVTGTTNGCSTVRELQILVNPAVQPSVGISYTGCPGNNLVFTATPTNGGSAPTYNWYVNESLQPGSGSSITINNVNNGTKVYAKLVSNAVCASPLQVHSDTVIVNCITTALPIVDGLEFFTISPNPSPGLLTVKMKLTQSSEVVFRVMDGYGRKVYESGPQRFVGTITKSIDLNGQPQGIYYLHTQIGRKVFVEKIILLQ